MGVGGRTGKGEASAGVWLQPDPQGLWSPEWVPPRGTGMAFYTQDACQSLAEVCEGMGCRGAPAANILSSGEMGPQPGEGAWEGH